MSFSAAVSSAFHRELAKRVLEIWDQMQKGDAGVDDLRATVAPVASQKPAPELPLKSLPYVVSFNSDSAGISAVRYKCMIRGFAYAAFGKEGGELPFSAVAKAELRPGQSSHSSPIGMEPTCCGDLQRQRSADSDLCKVTGSDGRTESSRCIRIRGSRRSPQVQPPNITEREHCGT